MTRTRHRSTTSRMLAFAAAALVLTTAACGDIAAPTTVLPSVGEILEVSGDVTIGGEDAGVGDRVRAGDRIATGPESEATVLLEGRVERCLLFENTEVVARPGDTAEVDVQSGQAWCRFAPVGPTVAAGSGGVEIRAAGAVVGIAAIDGAVTVKVIGGFATADGAVVGPGQTVTVSGGEASPPASFDPGPDGVAATDQLAEGLGIAYPDPPDPDDSAIVERVYERGRLFVAVDEDAFSGAVVAVIAGFFDGLSARWGLRPPSTEIKPLSQALAQLESGDVDVVVTPGTEEGAALVAGRNSVWRLVLNEEPTWRFSITAEIVAAARIGDLGALHRQAYGIEPDYSPWRLLLGI